MGSILLVYLPRRYLVVRSFGLKISISLWIESLQETLSSCAGFVYMQYHLRLCMGKYNIMKNAMANLKTQSNELFPFGENPHQMGIPHSVVAGFSMDFLAGMELVNHWVNPRERRSKP